jgi:uncharacterized heparinase superfamily protein
LVGSFTDGYKMAALFVNMVCRKSQLALVPLRMSLSPFKGNISEGLVAAPTDLRAVDPFVAEELLQGRIALAGRVLELEGRSPFQQELPSEAFAERLHAFSWLRHVRASKSDEACMRSRLLVADWIAGHGRKVKGLAWAPDVVAQRLIAWLSHSPIVLHDADSVFYRRFMKSLAFHIRYLRLIARHAPDGEIRLRIRIALAMASICVPMRASKVLGQGMKLDREIERQVLADGGHISRNPRVLLDLLLDLLPLRQSYINLGHDVPSGLVPAIDRIFPALRFFRHQDGDLALFNGAKVTLANELASVLRYDETSGRPSKYLPDMNYHRLSAGETTLIVDTGHASSTELSNTEHCGCLSFEMSSERNRFIVNSGFPQYAGPDFRRACRSTAAHSTVTLQDTSSGRVSRSRLFGPVVVSGVNEVIDEREADANGHDVLRASHDGYLRTFGYFHERELELNPAGTKIKGRDLMRSPEKTGKRGPRKLSAVSRFHIHPAIEVTQLNEEAILMRATDGTSWLFSVPGRHVTIAEDVFMADASGIRPSLQIEVPFTVPETREIRWIIERKE